MLLKIFLFIYVGLMLIPVYANSGLVDVEADKIRLISDKNIMELVGNVKLKYQDLVLKGDKAVYNNTQKFIKIENSILVKGKLRVECKKLFFYIDDNLVKAEKIQKIKYKNIFGKAQEADYNIDSKEIILTGKAHVKQGVDEFYSDKIIIYLEKGKIKALGKTKVTFTLEKLKR
ncbi:hypothetical protein HOC37_02895 [bacterium]|jgi:lipopolysaccharide transport protein LptA|nr:hypothetical protein [bacterium]MBT3581197.1 hypothetical protein [bacterium]MBT4551914.1 hypothetical protein [bacterium]MBT7087991.1 hypothetical protein [bacterium]